MSVSQVMAFTQRPELKMLLEIECKAFGGFKPLIHQSLEEFKSMLTLFDSIDILIVDEPSDQALFSNLVHEVQAKKNQIRKIIFLSNSSVQIDGVKTFAVQEVETFLTELKKMINPDSDILSGYISIPIDSLVHFNVLPFDLYVKIGDDKFVKRIPAHEEIDDQTFASFIQRGVSDLYFERKYNRDFSLMLINNMINSVEKEYDKIDEKLIATNNVLHTTHQIVSKLGFKPKIVEVCESVMNQILDDVSGGKDSFAKFLLQLRTQSELSISYSLMELTSFTATQILNEIEKNTPEDKVRRLIFASMFCDYSLKDPNQVHIRTQEQMAKLSATEQKQINEHALRSSELLMSYQNAPIEALAIIKQHHGSATGIGFPGEISPKILPLSMIFVVAQEISYQILMQNYRPPIEILSELKHKFIDTPLEDYFVQFVKSCRPT